MENENGYSTLSLYEAAAIETVTGAEPSVQRNSRGLVQMTFPRTPQVLAVVESWHTGLMIDARTFADKAARNFAFAKSWRESAR